MLTNKFGVYTVYENIEIPAPKGCKCSIQLAQDVDGWRSSYNYTGKNEGGGYLPNTCDKPSSYEEAKNKAISLLIAGYPMMAKYVTVKEKGQLSLFT